MNQMHYLAIPFGFGVFRVSQTVWTTWILMAILAAISLFGIRSLKERPGKVQTIFEAIIVSMSSAVEAVLPDTWLRVFPFIATLWLFVIVANLIGIVPGFRSPTDDLSATGALAVLVFFSVHWFGIRNEGLASYLRHYLSPTPLMLPFHIVSELSRTIALAVRLFGNMMSLEMAAIMIVLVAGFLVPVPILMLHIVEALVQAYIFGMLALIYIASGIESQRRTKEVASGP